MSLIVDEIGTLLLIDVVVEYIRRDGVQVVFILVRELCDKMIAAGGLSSKAAIE